MLLLTRLEAETIRDALGESDLRETEGYDDALDIIEALLMQDDHKHMKELLDNDG